MYNRDINILRTDEDAPTSNWFFLLLTWKPTMFRHQPSVSQLLSHFEQDTSFSLCLKALSSRHPDEFTQKWKKIEVCVPIRYYQLRKKTLSRPRTTLINSMEIDYQFQWYEHGLVNFVVVAQQWIFSKNLGVQLRTHCAKIAILNDHLEMRKLSRASLKLTTDLFN